MDAPIKTEASRFEFRDGDAVVSGPLTAESAAGLFRGVSRNATGQGPLETIDLAGVSAVDSAGLALLLEWQAQARAEGRRITVRNAPDSLLRLARLCEAVELLELTGREDAGSSGR